jgi:hypothetical protein
MAARKTTGIAKRHSRTCQTLNGKRCSCTPSWRATVNLDGQKIRATFPTKREAEDWRTETENDVRKGTIRRTPAGQPTVREAADEFLTGARAGTIFSGPGERYKAATLRGYERGLRLRVLPALATRSSAR